MLKYPAMNTVMIRSLWVLYFLCLIPTLVTLAHRIDLDAGFKNTALVADYVQLLELAQTENVPVDNVLFRVRNEAGIDHLALLEDTPQFLAQRGLCTIIEGVGWPGWKTEEERDEIRRNQGREIEEASTPENNWPLLQGLDHDLTHLIFSDNDTFLRIAESAFDRYPGLVVVDNRGPDGGVISLAGEPKIILEWGLGFDPKLVQKLRDLGLTLYPRLRHYPGYSNATVSTILSDTAQMFPDSVLIFDGDSILGSSGRLTPVAFEIRNSTLNFGWVEFAEQKGSRELAAMVPDRTARVHSIEDEEMEVITVERAIARYVRAVRERTARIVYLKPFLLQTGQTNRISETIRLFSGVKSELESVGYTTGQPGFVAELKGVNLITQAACVLALACALILLCYTLYPRTWIALPFLILIGVFLIWGMGMFGRKIIALGLAVTAPTLAVAWITHKSELFQASKSSILQPIFLWLGAVAISLTAGLFIHAILINNHTLLQIDAFSGVKIALYLPILLSVLIGVRLILPQENRTLSSAVSYLLNIQIKIWHVILALFGLIVLFIMLDRSGNFPILSVATWENQIRGWFETMLYARPRTKEMFIGHPALLIGLMIGFSGFLYRRAVMYAGLVIGSIALTSMVNTFCHIHTPLILSLFRTLAGVIIGGVLGILIGIILSIFLAKFSRSTRQT